MAAGRAVGTRRQVEVLLRLLENYVCDVALEDDWQRHDPQIPGPFDLDHDQLDGFLAAYPWQPATREQKRALLRGFYQWAVDTGRCDRSPAHKLSAGKIPAGQPKPCPDSILLAGVARATPQLQLMIQLGAYAGLRRSEIAGLHTDMIDLESEQLRITGKGGRVRIIPIHPQLKSALAAAEPGFLFPGRSGPHITPDAVGRAIAAALGGKWTAHTLRHRFATRAYASQRDLQAVQQLLGHSSPTTTARYTALPDDALRAAVDAV